MDGHHDLIPLIYDTTDDINNWYRVLEAICIATGAAKAILSLRDAKTAELIIPTTVEESHKSPLLYNFDTEYVESFLDQYIQHDPWTEIEKLYHPFLPYALSKYLHHAKLTSSKFWPWLQPQGISDTITMEVHSQRSQWVALNLYFAHDDIAVRDRAIDVLSALQYHMRKAWHVGEVVREAAFAQERTQCFLDTLPHAALLIRHDGTLITQNEKMRQLKNSPISYVGDRIGLRSRDGREKFEAELLQLSCASANELPRKFEIEDHVLSLSLIGQLEDVLGTDTATRLLTIMPKELARTSSQRPIWETSSLTLKQRDIVHHIALGGQLKQYAEKKNISIHTVDSHWRKAKKHLDVADPREVHTIHKVYCTKHGWS